MEKNPNNPSGNGNREIDLLELAKVLWSHIVVVIVISVLFAAAGYLYSEIMIVPQYTSSASLYVLNQADDSQLTVSDVSLSTALARDYQYIASSHLVVDRVINDLKLQDEYSYGGVSGSIGATILEDSRILKITYVDTDPYRAKSIVDQVAINTIDVAKSHMKMDIQLIDEGIIPTAPSSPGPRRYMMIGFLLGFVISAGFIVVASLLDDTIKTEADVEQYLHLPVLAAIPIDKQLVEREKSHKSGKKGGKR